MFRKLAILLALFWPAIALAGGPVNPPGPVPTTCTGGNAVTQYGAYGEALSCGTPTSTGTINAGSAPAVAQYQGASSVLVGPATISGATANIAVSNALAISTQTIFNAQSGATYTLLAGDNTKIVHLTNAAPVLTLLTAATAGSKYATTILCDSACTIDTAGGDTINGGASLSLVAGQSTQLVTDGVSVWYALGDGAVASVSGTAGQILVSPTTGAAVVSLPTTITKALTFSAANAYGTPASITLTNGTGLPLTTGVTGILPAANGGTGVANSNTLTLNTNTTLPAAPGSTQCLHMTTAGVVSTTGSDCGSSSSNGTVTNPANLTTHAPVVGGPNGTTDVKTIAALTTGQVALGVTGADPSPALLLDKFESIGWQAAVSPNNQVIVAGVNHAATITTIVGVPTVLLGSAGTIDVYDVASGTATCSSGTKITTTALNANASAGTNQTLFSGTYSLANGHNVCVSVTTGTFTSGTSQATITVYMSPT